MTESIDSTDDDIVTCRELDTTRESPAIQVVDVVAELEDADPADISPIYNCIDGLIADLFSSPPPAAADAELVFTYEGYRIHIQQDGATTFRHTP